MSGKRIGAAAALLVLAAIFSVRAARDGGDAALAADEPAVDAPQAQPLSVTSIAPAVVDPIGGSRVVVRGSGLSGVTALTIGGTPATQIIAVGDEELEARSGPVPAGAGLAVSVLRGAEQATLPGAVEAWSPAEIPGARLFDAASGIAGNQPASSYEWQRLSTTIAPGWVARDGNSLTYLPATGRFWMVGGWNPYSPPNGFDYVDPALGIPPHPTTNEVWSSADGIRWRKDLADDHPGFDRRHCHTTLLWRDKLWIVGGDWWREEYNHDVVSSPDGIHWTVELAQTPWQDRALLVAGVFDDKLWVMGGQTLHGPREDFVYHNDVWSSVDGVSWIQVAADAPPSETRWSGRGVFTQLVEFQGRMWLVGGGRYRDDIVGTSYFREVWSSADGVVWTQHPTPPWSGRVWHDVRAWDGKLWVLFGGNEMGNSNEAWFTEDGETWTALPAERSIQPGSHGQGVAATDDFLLLAGGNYSFVGWPTARSIDASTWRLRAFRGTRVDSWTDRGTGAVVLTASGEARPVLDPNALGSGVPGVQLDGHSSVLELAAKEPQPDGRSVFWVGRAPWTPAPVGWDTPPLLNPIQTVVGDGDEQHCAAGLAEGRLYYTSSAPAAGWVGHAAASGLQEGPGEVRFLGFTHDEDGTLQAWADGGAAGNPVDAGYTPNHGWSRVGAGGYAPTSFTAYAGTLGAVVILPSAADAPTVERMSRWAQGRFSTSPCSSVLAPALSLLALDRPLGEQRLALSGTLSARYPFDPAVDPIANGLHVEVRDAAGAAVIDTALPPGGYDSATRTGWQANRARTSFTFRHPSGVGGVTRAVVKYGKEAHGVRRLGIRLRGRGAISADPASLPLRARVTLRALREGDAQCGDLRFGGAEPPRCSSSPSGATVRCR